GRAEAHQSSRLDERDLGFQPWAASSNLGSVRLRVDAAFSTRLPLEVLDHVGDIDGLAIDASLFERAVEQLPCRTDEGMASDIFGVSRLLADEHQCGSARTLTEDGLRGALVEIARLAACRGVGYVGQGGFVWQQVRNWLPWLRLLRHGASRSPRLRA